MGRMTGRSAFTLIELMVVIAIIAIMAGLIAFLPKNERRLADVRSAAEELAATLREARAFALNRRTVCGVAFNIQNAPGTSGLLLNNNSGGHWYRVIGDVVTQDDTTLLASYPRPNFYDAITGAGNVALFLRQVQDTWIGDRHVLAPKKVRFLALTDQDNGSGGWVTSGRFPATYPRPWFGWWDSTTKRLRPWGGYDTVIKDNANRSCGGFYYEGTDGPITGSRDPADRLTTHIGVNSDVTPVAYRKAGQPRPVVNGDWLDYVIEFYPDGSAKERSGMINRRTSASTTGSITGGYSGGGISPGDLGQYTAQQGGSEISPMINYIRHTGVWSITLAPDVERDSDIYPTKEAALDSIWPTYRVTVSPYGDIKTVRVTRKLPTGFTLDTTTISNWQTTAQITQYYEGFIATRKDPVTNATILRGRPVADFLTPDIMAARQWWMP